MEILTRRAGQAAHTGHMEIYQDPFDGGELVSEVQGLRNPRSGALYAFREGLPVFLPSQAVEGPNLRYQRLYDGFATFYDLSTRLYALWKGGADRERRWSYLRKLEVGAGARVLEVSVGTGANWSYLAQDLQFHGVDLSWNMLVRCRRLVSRRGLRAELCQGLAEHLPYPSGYFDCVYHVGGINFFSDQRAALAEMVRVARSGTRLLVVDETEEVASRYENRWPMKMFFKNRPRKIEPPVDLLPPGMQEIAVETMWDGQLYMLTFRKPI